MIYKFSTTRLLKIYIKHLEEMSIVAEAISNIFKPDKMNYVKNKYKKQGIADEQMNW